MATLYSKWVEYREEGDLYRYDEGTYSKVRIVLQTTTDIYWAEIEHPERYGWRGQRVEARKETVLHSYGPEINAIAEAWESFDE